MDLMVGLETMGTRPGSAIVAIGAVFFDPVTGQLGDEFYRTISLASAVESGLKMDPATVTWWLQQDAAARHELVNATDRFSTVLADLTLWMEEHPGAHRVWGNGASYDNVLLSEAFDSGVPWEFRNDRCFRTLKNLFPEVPAPPFEGVKHNALADARHQAQHACAIFQHMAVVRAASARAQLLGV